MQLCYILTNDFIFYVYSFEGAVHSLLLGTLNTRNEGIITHGMSEL